MIEHRDGEYRLTRAGEELRPMIEQMAVWGERWVRREVSREDADAGLLMWAIRRSIRTDETPEERTVLHFHFPAAPQAKRCWWLVIDGPEVDMCLRDPGFDVDLTVAQRAARAGLRVDGRPVAGGGAAPADDPPARALSTTSARSRAGSGSARSRGIQRQAS